MRRRARRAGGVDAEMEDMYENGRAGRGRRGGALIVAAISAGIMALGGLLMFYSDPASGRRRRARLRDRVTHFGHIVTRDVPTRVEKRGRFYRGVARGVQHNMSEIVQPGHKVTPDDETLVARVRSEILRDMPAKLINIDAYEGCVTLRGQLDGAHDIQRIINRAKHVEGVREVRSYLHLPGTLPPNKAEIYEKERVPADLARSGTSRNGP
jgi:hypothetical protein